MEWPENTTGKIIKRLLCLVQRHQAGDHQSENKTWEKAWIQPLISFGIRLHQVSRKHGAIAFVASGIYNASRVISFPNVASGAMGVCTSQGTWSRRLLSLQFLLSLLCRKENCLLHCEGPTWKNTLVFDNVFPQEQLVELFFFKWTDENNFNLLHCHHRCAAFSNAAE